jgi:hypothetical protein
MINRENDQLDDEVLSPDLKFHVRRLNLTAGRLRVAGTLLALFTFSQIFVFVYSITMVRQGLYLFPSPFQIILFLALTNILLLVIRDVLKRVGDSLFEEITDEIQWSVIAGPKSDRTRPPLAVRYTLRTYSKASALPIFDGDAGPAAYGLLNILTLVASAYLQYLLR